MGARFLSSSRGGVASVIANDANGTYVLPGVGASTSVSTAGYSKELDITTTSAVSVSVVKQAGKAAAIATSSAVSVAKHVIKAMAWTTTDAVSAHKAAGKAVGWTTTNAVVAAAMRGRLVAVAIATTSALRILKRVSKIIGAGGIRVTIGGDTRTTMAGDIRVTQNAMVTSNTLTARKRVNKFLSWITSSTASFLRSHVHPVRVAIATTGAVVIRALSTVVGAVFTCAIAITTHGALSAVKQVGKTQSRTTASALRMARRTGKQILVSTSGAFSAVKRVSKRLAFVTHGAFSAVKQVGKRLTFVTHGALTAAKQIVRSATVIIATTETVAIAFNTSGFHPTKAINIATSSAVTVLRGLLRMCLVIASTAGAVAVGTAAALSKTILIAAASVLSIATGGALNLVLTIGTSSSFAAVKSVTSTISAATSSSLTLALKLVYGVVALIASTSSVALSTFASIAARLGQMFRLVGRWTRMVMSGQVSQMAVGAQVSQLELTGMSTHQNGNFHLGETWIVNGFCRDTTGAPLDLTNATVRLRIVTVDPNAIILDLSTPATGTILSPATAGAYVFEIAPEQQAAMTLTAYHYEVRAELGNGRLSVQNTGVIEVRPSKFVNFPI